MNREERLLKLHREKPDYLTILKACCEAHRSRSNEDHWLGFSHTDIQVDSDDFRLMMGIPRRLNVLANMGFLEVSFKSNSSTCYKVPEIEETERVLAEIEEARGRLEHEPTLSREMELPDDLFSTIAGYEDIKDLLKRALKVDRFHCLLCGSPASAKTLFLLELSRLPRSFYCLGSATTKAGLGDVLFEQRPRMLLADELDKFETKDIVILLSLAETGLVREVKSGKQREVRLNTSIFAAANTTIAMPSELLSRFRVLYLPEYGREEFLAAAWKVLVERETVDSTLASYIAEQAWELSRDIREAVRIGKLCRTEAEVDADMRLLRKYGMP